jgi:hypothetical protein
MSLPPELIVGDPLAADKTTNSNSHNRQDADARGVGKMAEPAR